MARGLIPSSLIALLIVSLFSPLPRAAAAPASTQSATPAAVVRLEGKIDDYSRDAFIKRFNWARESGAKVVIVDLDTYGGLVTAGLDLSRFLKSQTEVHTIAYVGQKAISAGAMIALACDEIVMAPGAQIGDCAPIAMKEDGTVQSLGETERAKSESPILADFRDSAQRNGYDPLLVQSMVSMKIAVHWAQGPAGERRFVDARGLDELKGQGWAEVQDADVPTPVDSDMTLLTVSGKTAAKLGLSHGTAPGYAALAADRNYAIRAAYAPNAADNLIEWLNSPFIRMLLIVVFALSIYAAFHAPGHGIAEAIAVIALALLVGVPMLTGYGQWWEIVVIVIGLLLLAAEIFVIPGFGVTGILGIVMIVFGLIMTFVGSEPAGPGILPRLEGTWTNIRNGLAMVATALVSSMVLSMWLRRFLPKLPYFSRLILTTTTGNVDAPPTTAHFADYRPVVGAIGESISELKPGGSAAFLDPITGQPRAFSVISDVGYVPRGTRLAVQSNGDNRIVVRPVVLS
jgi:membrane-bound serine protease (ClpP class)